MATTNENEIKISKECKNNFKKLLNNVGDNDFVAIYLEKIIPIEHTTLRNLVFVVYGKKVRIYNNCPWVKSYHFSYPIENCYLIYLYY